MDRLEAISIFVAVIDSGSLAAASRKLGRSPASVTRAVAQLEERAGERLLIRTTRRFAVTEAGHRHSLIYRKVLDDLSGLDAPASTTITGTIVVTAPEMFGRIKVLPVIQSFLSAHPGINLRLLLLNRMVDLVGEGVDIAIRLATLPDSSMTTVKVGAVRRLTCASPGYLAQHTPPDRPADLQDHWCIGLNEAGVQELWQYHDSAATYRARSVRVTCRLATNSAAAAIEAAENGAGIVRLLSYQVERQLADGSLVRLLKDYEPTPVPVHLVFRPGSGYHRAVRAFIDHAVPRLRQPQGAAGA